MVKSIFHQFREGQPRGQPKGPKSWPFGVSECGRFSEILIKKKVVWTLEASDSTIGDKRVFLPQSNRGFAVSGAQNIHKNSIFVRKDATSELDFEAENLRFRYKMWSNETALKQRKKTIFEPFREEPQSPKSGETEEKYGLSSLFRLQFSCETRLNLPCFSQRENCSPKTPN